MASTRGLQAINGGFLDCTTRARMRRGTIVLYDPRQKLCKADANRREKLCCAGDGLTSSPSLRRFGARNRGLQQVLA